MALELFSTLMAVFPCAATFLVHLAPTWHSNIFSCPESYGIFNLPENDDVTNGTMFENQELVQALTFIRRNCLAAYVSKLI